MSNSGDIGFTLTGGILLAAFLQIAVSVGLHRWGRSVAQKRRGRWWRAMVWAPLVALAMSFLGMVLTVVFLIKAFAAVSTVDPSMKATLLAKGISQAMNATALLAIPAYGLYLASAITFFVGWLTATD